LKFEPFIARRYLFSGQHKALVSVITFISIAGVAVGVFALIVVLAVMEGFDANLVQKIIGSYAHIEIVPAYNAPKINAERTLSKLRSMPEVKAAGPVIMQQALIQLSLGEGQTRQLGVFIQGLDLKEEKKITGLMDKVIGNATPTSSGLVMGKVAVQQLFGQIKNDRVLARVALGRSLLVMSPRNVMGPNGPVFATRRMKIEGIFETGFPETDQMIAYTSIEGARNLFVLDEDYIDGIHLVIQKPEKVNEVRTRIQRELGYENVIASTWQEKNPVLFDALRLEKWAMFVILLLIVLVAAFNIIGTLIMVVMEKTREIGIMKSMGATERSSLRIFLFQGLFIGSIGTGTGTVLGLFTCWLLRYHIHLPELTQAYLTDRIPVLVNPWMDLLIIGSSMAICLAASLYPARQAARLDPVEALRYE
jgi:lipoprotein-releasing system permease protein